MKNIKKGWIAAIITASLWALYALFLKTASTYMDNVNGLVVVLQAMVVGSFFLLILAGPGRLSLDTLRSGYTWSFGTLQILSNIFSFAALSYALSATSQTLLTRFSIVISVIFMLLLEKTSKKPSLPGFFCVLFGVITVAYSIDPEHRAIALFWILLMCLSQVARSRVAQKHKQSNQATGDFKAELRVAGYILAITSGFYALLLFVMMNLGFYEYIPQVIPSSVEFFALKPLLFAMCVGAVLMAIMRYTELIATKHIGGANFLTVTAFTPLCAYVFQWIFALFDIIPAPKTSTFEVAGGVLIILGAILLARKEVSKNKQKKLAPKAKEELLVLRGTIENTIQFCNDDEELVAKTLGIGKRTIKSILTTENSVSKAIKHKIIMNHAKHVVGLDQLTGALNQSSFYSKLKALKDDDRALVVFIDLDKFKPVNDTYGHNAGDSILQGVAERLMAEFEAPHIIARLGGDEFCAIIHDVEPKDDAKIIKKIKKAVDNPFIVEGIKDEISVGCSIGAAHYPTEGDNGVSLKEIADKRMYKNKELSGAGR